MKEDPKVTIVTVVFNLIDAERQNTFKQCVGSVCNQSYKNIEHLIIDGASKDGTIDLLKEYEAKGIIKYFSQPDDGIYDAMNKGIELASGKYIAFLNSDDFYNNKDAVKLSIEALERENADWSHANTLVLDESDNIKSDWKGSLEFIPFGMFPNHQTVFVKTDLIRTLGGFDLNYISMADNHIMMKLHSQGYKDVYIDETIVTFRPGGFSSSVVGQVKQDHIECFCNLYKEKLNMTKRDCEILYGFNYLNFDFNQNIDLYLKLAYYMPWQKIFLEKYISITKAIDDAALYWFKILPVFKIKRFNNIFKIYFLGLPIFKLKSEEEFVKLYVCGLRLAKLSIPQIPNIKIIEDADDKIKGEIAV